MLESNDGSGLPDSLHGLREHLRVGCGWTIRRDDIKKYMNCFVFFFLHSLCDVINLIYIT